MTVQKRWTLPVVALAALGLAMLGAVKLVAADADRLDCPGKIVCPLTGKLVCKDRCPALDANRPECPGRIVCPETGQLVCTDRCPLGHAAEAQNTNVAGKPSCCRKGK